VHANDGSVVAFDNLGAELSYRALPISHQNPTEGFELIVNPEIQAASPQGWATNGTTAGNNAIGEVFLSSIPILLTHRTQLISITIKRI
jgi:hypothetical protein